MAENTILDLDSMMDMEMSKVEDVPNYVTPPDGLYTFSVQEVKSEKYTSKAKDGKPETKGQRIRITYVIDGVVECDDAAPPAVGSMFSESFMATEDGLKYFKRQAKNIMNVEDLDKATLRDVMDGLTGTKFNAKTQLKKSSDGFENIRVTPVHAAANT
jgi:hypothetical protein